MLLFIKLAIEQTLNQINSLGYAAHKVTIHSASVKEAASRLRDLRDVILLFAFIICSVVCFHYMLRR